MNLNLNFENMNNNGSKPDLNQEVKPPISKTESEQDLARLKSLGFAKVVEELSAAGIENPEEIAKEILGEE